MCLMLKFVQTVKTQNGRLKIGGEFQGLLIILAGGHIIAQILIRYPAVANGIHELRVDLKHLRKELHRLFVFLDIVIQIQISRNTMRR